MKKQNKMKKAMGFLFNVALFVLAFVTGASADVFMANASNLPDAGQYSGGADMQGDGNTPSGRVGGIDGIATETAGRAMTEDDGNPNFYMDDVDKRVVKIRPMATPVDQISRYAKAEKCDSFVVKYYSVGTREIKCKTSQDIPAMAKTVGSTKLYVDDSEMFTLDDTIRVIGKRCETDGSGNYTLVDNPSGSGYPDLVLCVCGMSEEENVPVVFAVNGGASSTTNQPIVLPAIPTGTALVRMGKACAEMDSQTGRFFEIPEKEEQYCQNFMMQVEQSTFDKIAKKEANWDFSDLEEDAIYDMRVAMENSWLFGAKGVIRHKSKGNSNSWFTGGIWYMAGKDIEVGTYNTQTQTAEISDDNLVDITKELFVGTGIGNKRKILLCGSDMLAAFSKIKSDKFRLKDTVEVWNLRFKSWETDFGEVLTIHHELFDFNGMSDCGFALDPEYLSKRTHLSWGRSIIDMDKIGVRNSQAVRIREVSCLFLRYAKAHARLKLAQA